MGSSKVDSSPSGPKWYSRLLKDKKVSNMDDTAAMPGKSPKSKSPSKKPPLVVNHFPSGTMLFRL
jgi:hypothetical protein